MVTSGVYLDNSQFYYTYFVPNLPAPPTPLCQGLALCESWQVLSLCHPDVCYGSVSLVRPPFSPTTLWSDHPLVRPPLGPTGRTKSTSNRYRLLDPSAIRTKERSFWFDCLDPSMRVFCEGTQCHLPFETSGFRRDSEAPPLLDPPIAV